MKQQASEFVIDLPMGNQWENVELMRTSILSCFTVVFPEHESVHAFATIAAELLENAIKYGHWDDAPDPRLHLRVWGDGGEAHVQVENPVAADSADVSELLRTIGWLNAQPSAEDAYRARLLDVAKAPRGVSKLGLARIAYEGACSLDAQLDGNWLRVTSVTRLQRPS